MRVLLLNPNGNVATTAMMLAIARRAAPAGWVFEGATHPDGPEMIVDAAQLAASVEGTVAMGLAGAPGVDGIIVSAFGDPGLERLAGLVRVPVVGIAKAGLEAGAARGRFGVATVTHGLAGVIAARVAGLGLAARYTGIRLTEGDAVLLAREPALLVERLAGAVERCMGDGAEAVVIGGGPLGDAAAALEGRFGVPVVSPIVAAVAALARQMEA